MAYEIEYAYFCHRGLIRANNEDNYWCAGESLEADHEGSSEVRHGCLTVSDGGVLAVFDGMGGESCGEIASWLGSKTMGETTESLRALVRQDPEGFMREAGQRMNSAVVQYARENRIGSMGSTMVGAAFGENGMCVYNLGDSRAYLLKDRLKLLSTDHVSHASFWGKPPLIQFLGLPEEEYTLSPSSVVLPYEAGQRLLLCTDGITDMLSEKEIGIILAIKEQSITEAAGKLLEEALKAGGRDNATAIVCEIREKRTGGFFSILKSVIRNASNW